jgi:hypothetical protein
MMKKQQKSLRLKLLRSCIREALIHVGCDFPVPDIVRNSDSEIPEGLIELSDQVKWYTIVPVYIFKHKEWLQVHIKFNSGKIYA